MKIPWHASQSDIAFLHCGTWASNRGNGMRVFEIDKALAERMLVNGTCHRSYIMIGAREDKLNRLSLWSKSSRKMQLTWGHRCEECEEDE